MKNPTKTPITRASLLATASYNNRWFAGILASTTVLGTGVLHAVTWDGSDSTAWNTATNWVGDVVPNGAVATISSTTPNIATITAPLTGTPNNFEIGRAGLAGRLDHVSGAAANAANTSMFIGSGGAGSSGIYNLANTAVTGAGVSGYGQGSGSMTIGGAAANNGDLLVGDSATSTGVININTTGTLVVTNDVFIGRNATTAVGTMNLESGTVTAGAASNGCWTAFGRLAGKGTLNMTGGTLRSFGSIYFARDASSIGIGNLSGGLLEINTNGEFVIGQDGGNGTLNQTGGAIQTNNREFWVGQGTNGVGVFNLSAGTVNVGSWVAIGRGAGTGTVTMTGGTFTKTGAGTSFIVGASGPGTLTQSAGTIDVQAGDTWMAEGNTATYTLSGTGEFISTVFQVARNAGSTGNVNLNGGTLRTTRIVGGGGTENISFNGTQIIAKATDPNFISGIDAAGATIDAGGLKVNSNGFNVTASAALDGAGGITKSGLGTFTLSSLTNSYTGSNTVQAGQLVLHATGTGTGTITVSDGAALGVASSDGTQFLTSSGVTLGTSGATTLNMNRGDLVGAVPTNALLKVTGPLVRNGTTTVNVTGSRFAVGNLPLIAYDSTQVSGSGTFNLGTLPDGVIGTLQNDPNFFGSGQGAIYLDVDSVALPKWTGKLVNRFTTGTFTGFTNSIVVANATGIAVGNVVSGPGIAPGTVVTAIAGTTITVDLATTADGTASNVMFAPAAVSPNAGVWDTTTTNWVDQVNGAPSLYANPNPVLFDDDAPGPTAVTLDIAVSPSNVTFNNSTLTYSLSGTGSIGGANGLIKKGTGEVTVSTANTYDGITRLEGGTLTIATIENGGVTSPIGDSSAAPANLVIAGGMLHYTGPSKTIDRGFTLDGLNGGISNDNDLTITGQVLNTGLGSSMRKAGAGTLKFTFLGANTFSSSGGISDVEGGTLTLDGTGTGQINTITGELWVGSEPNVNATLNVLNTTLNISSWLAIARGNGDDGVTTVNVTNSTLTTGNFSNGFANALGANASEAIVNVTGSSWTNAGAIHLSEQFASSATMTLTNSTLITTGGITDLSTGANSTSTLTIAGTSEMRTNRFLMGLGTDSIGTVIIKDSGHLNKTGGDWMSIGNGNNGKGFVTVEGSGKLTNAAGDFNISDTGTSQGTLTIKDSAQVTTAGTTFVGKNSGTQGTLDISGGTFTATASFLAGGTDNAGATATAIGIINQTGGAVILNGDDNRTGCSGTATWNISAGSVTSNGWMTIARYTGGFGTMNVSGSGTVTQNHANRPFRVAELGTAVLNISGGGLVSAPNTGGVTLAGNASASGTINLSTGGTLMAHHIAASGADGNSVVNLKGGTLKASPGAALNWIPAGLDTLNLDIDGVIIDTNGQNVGIAQTFADGGGTVTKQGTGTLLLNAGNSFIGSTTVTAGELGGTGSVGGELVVEASGAVAPGALAVGTFTADDILGIGSSIAGTYICELDGATADTLAIGGNLDIQAGAKLDFNVLNAPTAPSYVIATFVSRTGPDFTVVDLPAGYEVQYSATQITLVQTGGTPYNNWAQSFGLDPLTNGAPGADPDGDGNINSVEFALGGSPVSGSNNAKIYNLAADSDTDGDANKELLMTIAVRTGTPAFTGSPSPTATQDGYTYTIQGSTTLGAFTTVVTPTATAVTTGLPAAPAGYEYRTFSLSGSNGLPAKGFLRVLVTP